jgi:hypothetical protein
MKVVLCGRAEELMDRRRCSRHVSRLRIALPIVALVVACLAGAIARAESAAGSPSVTVPCDKIILRVRLGTTNGYRTVLGVVSVPRESHHSVQGASPTGQTWPYFRKMGLVIRGGAPLVTVSVPPQWRRRVAIAWGNSDVVSSIRIAPCGTYSEKPWNAYAGGFFLRSPTACVPLTIRVGRRATTVRFGIGRTCSG